jgi:hypothetical protein
MLATQDINKLGTELEQKALTSDTTTLISFRTQQSADFVARLSGSVKKQAVTFHFSEGETDNQGSVREENDYRIHPNFAAQLPDGFCYILRHRTFCKVRFFLPDIPPDVPPEPVYTPPPKPIVPNLPPKNEPKKNRKVRKLN